MAPFLKFYWGLLALISSLHLIFCGSAPLFETEEEPPRVMLDEDRYHFHVIALNDEDLADSLWVDMESVEKQKIWRPAYTDTLERTNRHLSWLSLSFDFPFYGYKTRDITIDIDGKICMQKLVYLDEECYSYVAPLGTKMSFGQNESYLKYLDTGDSFTVQWGNVDLYPPYFVSEQNLSMQATLYIDGEIQFVYKQIESTIYNLIDDDLLPDLVIGASDSKRPFDVYKTFPHQYGVLALHESMSWKFDIGSGTVIEITPLPYCNQFLTCKQCVTAEIVLACAWCHQINRCSNYGIDRSNRDWVEKDCISNYTDDVYNDPFCY